MEVQLLLHTIAAAIAHQSFVIFLKHVSSHPSRGVYSRQNGKNATDVVPMGLNVSESIENVIGRIGTNISDAQALFDALMKRKSTLSSSINNLTAGVQALCHLGRSDLAVCLYENTGAFECVMSKLCNRALTCDTLVLGVMKYLSSQNVGFWAQISF